MATIVFSVAHSVHTDRLDEKSAQPPSIGSVADTYDNATVETTIGLHKTGLHRNPCRERRPLEGPR